MPSRILEVFTRWFCSAAGVWQTFIITAAWTIVEVVNPSWDPSFLKFMAVLTIYSAVTQPALAYVASLAGGRTDVALAEELNLVKEELQLIKEERQILQRIAETLGVSQ